MCLHLLSTHITYAMERFEEGEDKDWETIKLFLKERGRERFEEDQDKNKKAIINFKGEGERERDT